MFKAHCERTLSLMVIRWSTLFCLFAVGGATVGFSAESVSLVASQSVIYEDNARLSHERKESEITLSTEIGAGWQQQTKHISIDANYAMSYVRRRLDDEDNTRQVDGNGRVTWHVLPSRVQWYVADNESYSIIDRKEIDTDSNRSQQRSISTGPQINIPLSPVDSLSLAANYTVSRQDTTEDNGSKVRDASASLSHRFSTVRSVDLSLSTSRTSFNNSEDEPETIEAFIAFNASTASGSFSAGLGINRLTTQGGADSEAKSKTTSNSFDISYSSSWGESQFQLSVSKQLKDSISSFYDQDYGAFRAIVESSGVDIVNSSGVVIGQINNADDLALIGIEDQSYETEDVVIQTGASISVSKPIFTPVTHVTLGFSYSNDELQTQKDTQKVLAYDMTLSHALSEHLIFNASYRIDKSEFDTTNNDSADTERTDFSQQAGIGVSYSLSNDINISAQVDASLRRVGREGEEGSYNVSNKSVSLSVSYKIK